ncbi:hypothetical protein EDB84DRAFT_1501220, partial [Lactarius hengduanensis]
AAARQWGRVLVVISFIGGTNVLTRPPPSWEAGVGSGSVSPSSQARRASRPSKSKLIPSTGRAGRTRRRPAWVRMRGFREGWVVCVSDCGM